jgi:AcrR family transcriptional regulator
MRLLDRVGIADFTMRALADEVGLSPMAAYKHFSNQRALQLELWRACQNHFYDALLEATEPHTDAGSAFLALCRAFMEYAVAYPYRYELLYNHPFAREVANEPELAELARSVWSHSHDLVRRAQTDGIFRTDVGSEVVLAAATNQVRGLASTMIFSMLSPFEDLDLEILIESGLAFIRDAIMPR